MQLHQDEPLQYFFNFNKQQPSLQSTLEKPFKRLLNTEELRLMNFPRTSKIEVFPQAQNSLLVRIENIADRFDVGTTGY